MQYGIVNKRWFKIGRNRRKDKYSSIQAVKYSTTYNRKGFLFILRRIGLEDMASADLPAVIYNGYGYSISIAHFTTT
jgi:hypothetical protein